jgi:transposase
LPNGRALTGQSHDYKRHGTTTLFAALEVATGKIIATHSKRRRRVEFLDFMNGITAAFPNRKLHVILDNLNTHKKNEHWLKAHPNVQFHFTPTSASWLNQVEVWFSILQGQSLSGASFTSLKQLEQHIDAYIKAYNDKAEPFVWTKKKVRQRRFKGRRITQLRFRVLARRRQSRPAGRQHPWRRRAPGDRRRGPETLGKLQKVFAARKVALKRIHGLVIADENGNWLTSSGAMGKNLSDREYFRHHQRSIARDAFIGRPIKSNTNDEWIVTVSRRFNHPDGSFAGVVVASIGAKYFRSFIGSSTLA